MRTLLLAAALILAVPTASRAEFGLGLRLGMGWPGGDLMKSSSGTGFGSSNAYTNYVKSSTPIQLDLMWRTTATTAAGLYVGYAPNTVGGDLKSLCNSTGLSCSSNTFRVGVQVTGELLDLGLVGIWGGIGTGYEALNMTLEGGGQKIEAQLRGWEWATISAGADLKLIKLFKAGIYASYGFGQFSVESVKSPTGDLAGGIGSDKATHNLFQLGLRGMFDL